MPHQPPKDVQETAQRAERWIEEGRAGQGFTDVGLAWDAWGGDAGERWVGKIDLD